MNTLVEEQLNTVMAKSMDEIRMLPDFTTVEVAVEKGIVKLTTYHESMENNVHRLIVQATRPGWFGLINAVTAEGYEVSSDGGRRRLKPEELYTYT